MTITYKAELLRQVLFRWRGSLWHAVWKELLIWLVLYYVIMAIYRAPPWAAENKLLFERLILEFETFTKILPLTFVLGFYVGIITKRWWEQFMEVETPDTFLLFVKMVIAGRQADQIRKRRCIARWVVLTEALAWREVSLPVRKRFPSLEYLVSSKLMTQEEMVAIDSVNCEATRWSLPINWIQKMLMREINHKPEATKTLTDGMQFNVIKYLTLFRKCCVTIFMYDWVSLPLVYTQVVTIAVYGFFAFCLLGRQFLAPDSVFAKDSVNYYFPFFTVLQFMFYVGWFKVGMFLLRPFGEDDEDIELNYFLDRNLQEAFSIVDESAVQDVRPNEGKFGDIKNPILTYTKFATVQMQEPPIDTLDVHFADDADEFSLIDAKTILEQRTEGGMYF